MNSSVDEARPAGNADPRGELRAAEVARPRAICGRDTNPPTPPPNPEGATPEGIHARINADSRGSVAAAEAQRRSPDPAGAQPQPAIAPESPAPKVRFIAQQSLKKRKPKVSRNWIGSVKCSAESAITKTPSERREGIGQFRLRTEDLEIGAELCFHGVDHFLFCDFSNEKR
jgi:hypothetical protein